MLKPITSAMGPLFNKLIVDEQRLAEVMRVVIYARYSSRQQDEASIEAQVEECRRYAKEHEMVVMDVYEDRAETGRGRLNRASYMRLLETAQQRSCGFTAILVLATNRWGRDSIFQLDVRRLESTGVKVIPITAPWLAEDRAARAMYACHDEVASIQNGRTTFQHQSYNARLGNRNGGIAPDGYAILKEDSGRKDKRGDVIFRYKLILDMKPGPFDKNTEPRYKVVETTFVLAEQGKGPRAIGKILFEMGFRKKTADGCSVKQQKKCFSTPDGMELRQDSK